jgi:REP element-mobilizing transposase RayT
MRYPHAFHITFGTYLSRPPGSAKPHVDRHHNRFGEPLAPTDPAREHFARAIARSAPVWLSVDQRSTVEEGIRDVAVRYGWRIDALAVNSDHVHAVIAAEREGNALRDAVKAAGSRALNKRFARRDWWAEGGSVKYLWDLSYFRNAVEYVAGQNELPELLQRQNR